MRVDSVPKLQAWKMKPMSTKLISPYEAIAVPTQTIAMIATLVQENVSTRKMIDVTYTVAGMVALII